MNDFFSLLIAFKAQFGEFKFTIDLLFGDSTRPTALIFTNFADINV